MARYIVVSIASGVLLGVLDGLLNANPLAQRLNEVYAPTARTEVNFVAGILIDLAYGFVMAGVFLLLLRPRKSLSSSPVARIAFNDSEVWRQ